MTIHHDDSNGDQTNHNVACDAVDDVCSASSVDGAGRTGDASVADDESSADIAGGLSNANGNDGGVFKKQSMDESESKSIHEIVTDGFNRGIDSDGGNDSGSDAGSTNSGRNGIGGSGVVIGGGGRLGTTNVSLMAIILQIVVVFSFCMGLVLTLTRNRALHIHPSPAFLALTPTLTLDTWWPHTSWFDDVGLDLPCHHV